MLLTLDSSLIVAALRRQEAEHRTCLAILSQVVAGRHRAIDPFTVLVEVVAAIRRRTGSAELASRIQRSLPLLPNVQFVELDRERAEAAADTARQSGLRGMDAVIVATAREFGATLVTLDVEVQQRAHGLVAIATPADIERIGRSTSSSTGN